MVLFNRLIKKIKVMNYKMLLNYGNSLFTSATSLNMFLFEIFDSSSLWGNSVVTVVGVGVLYDLQA